MNAELEELKTILASEKQFSELGYASKYKELGSKKNLLPVATLIVMFIFQVNNQYFFSRKDPDLSDQTTGSSSDDGFIFKNLNEN